MAISRRGIAAHILLRGHPSICTTPTSASYLVLPWPSVTTDDALYRPARHRPATVPTRKRSCRREDFIRLTFGQAFPPSLAAATRSTPAGRALDSRHRHHGEQNCSTLHRAPVGFGR